MTKSKTDKHLNCPTKKLSPKIYGKIDVFKELTPHSRTF